MDETELGILRVLDGLVNQGSLKPVFDAAVARAEHKLAQDPDATMAWEPVPVSTYGDGLPDTVRSSWVFVLRGGASTSAERHPNSHQRMMAYRGSGDLQIRTDAGWRSNRLLSDPGAPIERRWISIPPSTWHQAVVPAENWVVVSFHTVPEDELIEERPDASHPDVTRQRLYVDGRNDRGA